MTFKMYSADGKFIEKVDIVPKIFSGMLEWPSGTKAYYVNSILHKLDGPAIEWTSGTKEWFIDGKQITEEQCKLLHDIMKLKGLA